MLEIIQCEQNSPEWLQARLGIPTASQFATVMAKGVKGGQSKTRQTYLYKLLGERLTGEPAENYTNAHMERGHLMEAEARAAYAILTDSEPELVGFIRNGDKGASPDSLLGDNGLLEIKTKLPHLQLAVLEADAVPPEHIAQIQGQIWIAEREWADFASYWPKLPLFHKRVYRDDVYIKSMEAAVRQFNEELSALEAKYREAA